MTVYGRNPEKNKEFCQNFLKEEGSNLGTFSINPEAK